MADQDGTAPATADSASGQPAASAPDKTQELIERYKQQVAGGQAFYQTAKNAGLSKPEDIQKAGALYQALVSSGIDPEEMARTVAQNPKVSASSQAMHQVAAPAIDENAFAQSVVNILDQREAARRAVEVHQTQYAAESSIISKLVGSTEGLTAKERKIVELAVESQVDKLRADYPVGHPLHGRSLQTADENLVKTALEAVLKKMNAEAGQEMASKADALRAGLGRIPTAGNNGGLATPVAATPGSQRPVNPLKMPEAQKQAILAEIQAKRGR